MCTTRQELLAPRPRRAVAILALLGSNPEIFGDESVTQEVAERDERWELQRAGLTPPEIEARKEEIEERAKTKVGVVGRETMVYYLAWEAYAQVEQLQEIARKYPKHVRHGARRMHGWPMVICQHIDGRAEFEEMVKLLEVGPGYPLDVLRRKKRGNDSPMLRYLDPLICRLDALHSCRKYARLGEENAKAKQHWDYLCGGMRGKDTTKEQVVEALRGIATVGRLTKATARDWTTKVPVPLTMVNDAKTPETCEVPVLKNI